MANQDNANVIISTAQRYGLPAWIPLDTARWESGLNPNSVGDHGTSFGLFQLHRGGLAPSNLSDAQLKDPKINADIAVRAMKSGYDKGVKAGYSGYALEAFVANSSGWPGSLGPAWTAKNRPDYTAGLQRTYSDNATEHYIAAYGGTVNESGLIGDAMQPGTHYADSTYHSAAAGTFRVMSEKEQFESYTDWSANASGWEKIIPLGYLFENGRAVGVRALVVVIGLVFLIFAIWAVAQGVKYEVAGTMEEAPQSSGGTQGAPILPAQGGTTNV